MNIAIDKKLHFSVWFFITSTMLIVFYLLDIRHYFLIANAVALCMGFLKEIFDCFKMKPTGITKLDKLLIKFGFIGEPSGFSWMDIVADVVGIILANIFFIILKAQ